MVPRPTTNSFIKMLPMFINNQFHMTIVDKILILNHISWLSTTRRQLQNNFRFMRLPSGMKLLKAARSYTLQTKHFLNMQWRFCLFSSSNFVQSNAKTDLKWNGHHIKHKPTQALTVTLHMHIQNRRHFKENSFISLNFIIKCT